MNTDLGTETTGRVLTDWEVTALDQNIQRMELMLDFIKSHPLIGATTWVSGIYASASNKEEFQFMLDELGTFDKSEDTYNVNAKQNIGPEDTYHMVTVSLDHSLFCERVEDGVELVEERTYPDDIVPEIVTKSVPKYKWVCPPSWKDA